MSCALGIPPAHLPLVVLPHGGPEARDFPRFDWWVQFLATRAVSVNGVSDLPEMAAYLERRRGSGALHYWREHIGAPFDPSLLQRSPVHAVDRIKASILLLHASDDTVVPFAQSASMAHALASAHKAATLVALPGEDHWLSRSETRTRMLQELEKFLAAHL